MSVTSAETQRGPGATAWVVGSVARLVGAAALWWVLTDGSADAWSYAVVILPVATAVSLACLRPRRWRGSVLRRAWAALQLAGWFGYQSWRGGWDVAHRALRTPVRTDPVDLVVPMSLQSRRARVTLAAIASLTPGSLSIDLLPASAPGEAGAHELHVHVLHHELDVARMIRQLERAVARVWGEDEGQTRR